MTILEMVKNEYEKDSFSLLSNRQSLKRMKSNYLRFMPVVRTIALTKSRFSYYRLSTGSPIFRKLSTSYRTSIFKKCLYPSTVIENALNEYFSYYDDNDNEDYDDY